MKKLLVATSALVVAGPAFANDVTLSGTFAGKYSTEDATELSGGVITTLTVNLAFKGDNGFGGNLELGNDDNPDLTGIGAGGVNIYAETALGKFNVGTDTGTKTDDDLTEMNQFNDGDTNVGFSHGLMPHKNNGLDTFLTYSNDFGPVSSAVTWADDGYVFSAGLELAGFDLALDYSSGRSGSIGGEDSKTDASYVINAVGSLAGITVELEYGTGKDEKDESADSAYDLYLAYDLGVAKLALGTASNSDQELEVSGDLGDFGYKLYFGNDENDKDSEEKSYTGFEVSTQVGAIEAGLKTSDVNGTTSTELYLIPVSGFEIELVDSGDEADAVINFKVATSF